MAVRLDEAKHRDVNHGFADDLTDKSDRNVGVRWAFRILSVAFAMLSIVLLIKHGFDMPGFAAPLQFVLNYYEALINVLLGWTEPYLHAVLAFLRDLLGLDLRLTPLETLRAMIFLLPCCASAAARDYRGYFAICFF